jgi:hypothetical protein
MSSEPVGRYPGTGLSRRSCCMSCGAMTATGAKVMDAGEAGSKLTDAVIELRNYTLVSGARDTLIALFEREFVESQEALGARIPGTFRHLDEPDHFVWLRSFKDMVVRRKALEAFYGGPVWRAHGKAAVATMLDSDDVYLLQPSGLVLRIPTVTRPAAGSPPPQSMFVVDIYAEPVEAKTNFGAVAAKEPAVVASFITEPSLNDYPALPVHADRVFVAIRRFDSVHTVARIGGLPKPNRTLRLQPTSRSLIR